MKFDIVKELNKVKGIEKKLSVDTKYIETYYKNNYLLEGKHTNKFGIYYQIKKGEENENNLLKEQYNDFIKFFGKYDFPKKIVFHRDHIEKVCKKYRLKCLNSIYYKGEIPYDLSEKIESFEKLYNIKVDGSNLKILSHCYNFKNTSELHKKGNALLFYVIMDEHYCLIDEIHERYSILNAYLWSVQANNYKSFFWLMLPTWLMILFGVHPVIYILGGIFNIVGALSIMNEIKYVPPFDRH